MNKKEKLYNGMPYISDKKLYAAVMFAKKMIKEVMAAGLANYKAAKYYGFDTSEVAHYIGIYANSRGKTTRKKDTLKTFYCVEHQWNVDKYGTIKAIICEEKEAYTKPSNRDESTYNPEWAIEYKWFDSKEKALKYIGNQEYWGEYKIEIVEGKGWYVSNEIDLEPKTPCGLFLKMLRDGEIL